MLFGIDAIKRSVIIFVAGTASGLGRRRFFEAKNCSLPAERGFYYLCKISGKEVVVR